jgi:hypothetical protein
MKASTWFGIDFAKCFMKVANQLGGFLQPVHQQRYLGTARMRHQQPHDGERAFFKFLELGPQLLAILVQLLQ